MRSPFRQRSGASVGRTLGRGAAPYDLLRRPDSACRPLILAVIKCESDFDSRAVSRKGARGLMQVMPATAAGTFDVHPDQLFTPAINIDTGTAYLGLLADRYRGRTLQVLGAYNAGPSRIDSGSRLPRETRAYIRCVGKAYEHYAPLTAGNKEGAIQ